jgi:hypothetical protein
MIKVLNSANETQAILDNVIGSIVSEEINRNFTYSFTTVIDGDKSDYVNYQNKVETEGNYFNIVFTEESRSQEGIFIKADCEHVSYDLLETLFTAGFTATGLFSAVATTVLSGTDFSIGSNQITSSQTISVNESTNARQLLLQLAALYGGELQFSKYQVNLLTRRGADRGVQFRYRKNLVGVSRIVDNRKKVGGLPTISYAVNVAELEFEQGFIADGVGVLEHYELGDSVRVIDDNLNINESLRIVSESHDTEQRMQGSVEIGNFVDNLTDTLTTIQTTAVAKDSAYNGCSIGPNDGFVATRSDDLVKTSMNATNGIQIDLRDSTTASYTAVFYVQVDTATGTANLYLAGNAVFTGDVIASDITASDITGSDITGGTLLIGTTNKVKIYDSANIGTIELLAGTTVKGSLLYDASIGGVVFQASNEQLTIYTDGTKILLNADNAIELLAGSYFQLQATTNIELNSAADINLFCNDFKINNATGASGGISATATISVSNGIITGWS